MKRIFGATAAVAVISLLIFAFLPSSTSATNTAGQPMLLPPHSVPLVAETVEGDISFVVEVADDETERSRGLMFRQSLPDDRGMLFIFEATGQRGFWMKNTPLPLDLIFVAESGRVVAIRHGEPFSEETVAPIYPVRFVLELKAGTARKHGVRIGTRLRHPLVDAISGVQ